MTVPVEPYGESVHEAVARETTRRKRVLLAFLGLLLVPISIGAYALSQAASETEQVVTQATPIVTQRAGEQIATRVTNDVVTRTEPLIRQNVSREIAGTVEPRIAQVASTLQRDISTLQSTVRETATAVAATRAGMPNLSGFEARLTNIDVAVDRNQGLFQSLQDGQERLRVDVAAEREFRQGLSRNIGQISGRLENEFATRQQVAALQQTIATDLAAIRSLANASVQTANRNRVAIGNLGGRVLRIEQDLKKLQQQVTSIIDDR